MPTVQEQIENQYNSIAKVWRSKLWVGDSEFEKKIRDFANLDPGANLLDVGIGAGDFSGLLGAKSVTGVDISEGMLERCRKLHPDFKIIKGDAQHLPLKDNSFDVVCCRNLLQNFNDPSPAFQEMIRVLKPGGKVLVVESAVYEKERHLVTEFCRIAEPFCPPFPSHGSLRELFISNEVKNLEQAIIRLRRKWFQKQQKSKRATEQQKTRAYKLCENYPDSYKQKYQFKFFPKETEIESILTFSFLKGTKPKFSDAV